jgi:hypothetical protein
VTDKIATMIEIVRIAKVTRATTIEVNNTMMTTSNDDTRNPQTPGGTKDRASQGVAPPITAIPHHHRRDLEAVLVGRKDAACRAFTPVLCHTLKIQNI